MSDVIKVDGNILEVSGVCKVYPEFELRDVTFTLPRGCIMGFVGQNGAGKTTTLKSILSLIKCNSGSVKLFGENNGINGGNNSDNGNVGRNTRIGIVMDLPYYPDAWTVSDAERAVSPFYTNWDSAAFAAYIKKFGITAGKKIKELSRGMKVKLQLSAALSHGAELLILDEPTSGLDPVARDEICDILLEFIEDKSKGVLFSTHITSDLEKIADYITFIMGGQIVFSGMKNELLKKYVYVSGKIGDISEDKKAKIIGYREHGKIFEGMMYESEVPAGIDTEVITLEQIIIFMNKENRGDE